MTEDQIIAFCDALPGARRATPFGPEIEVWTVGDKIFAMMAHGSGRVSVKCADDDYAEMLLSVGRAGKGPHLPRGGWLAVEAAALGATEMDTCLRKSYQAVRDHLPDAVRAKLG